MELTREQLNKRIEENDTITPAQPEWEKRIDWDYIYLLKRVKYARLEVADFEEYGQELRAFVASLLAEERKRISERVEGLEYIPEQWGGTLSAKGEAQTEGWKTAIKLVLSAINKE
jgi:hypothetical protein